MNLQQMAAQVQGWVNKGLPPCTDVLEDTLDTDTSYTDTTTKEYTNRWVRNLSEHTINTGAQVSLLSHGPNFAVAPRHPPWGLHHCN